ncbi:DUF1206 domain-containing protein [Palleronia sediminis]|uniref:DUF1206 domain-containing protein n=1 Tax=Palleronia sediminis TaxID=2547833 RepID=A0A4R6APH5_9RHOB|nr:DUF1206 domain-containing protein [Palleronia sediminis]TDL83543.1 DUF1206 domain-containing protein [Palleronia sediminis]
MSDRDFGWAVPIMRAGYAGRALVYFTVAGFSLWALWQGGSAKGTSSALARLETTTGGGVVLFLIFVGMVAYAVWRLLDAAYDLEAYGSDGEGTVARLGMLVTGAVHLAIGIAAFSLLFSTGGGGGSSITSAVGAILGWPGGRWILGIGGLVVIGAGIFYAYKGIAEKYRAHLRSNEFTRNWNWVLKLGLIAQGGVIAVIGGLILYAAMRADPQEAGGVGAAFSWISEQAYGQILVAAVCVGLVCFGIFCAVNARYRIVNRAAGDDIETLAGRAARKAT